ncbi:ImmA/IrrE family metallo-endopeptidase [soil metagenome]
MTQIGRWSKTVTLRAEGLLKAEAAAEAMLHRFGARLPAHIRVEAFASAFGVTIVDGQLDGARARLTRGKKPQIRVSERTPSEAARRFSIAHELGHHVLDHFGDKPHAVCTETLPKVPRHPNKRDYESEAQAFAANTLMPRSMVSNRCEHAEPSLEVAKSIVGDFKTSLPASTIRFVELSRACCAAVLTVNGMISWAVGSPTFTSKIARGRSLDPRTIASSYHLTGKSSDKPRTLPATAWISANDNDEIVEHSMPVDEGGVISLVWLPKNGDR